jgi:cytidylate kinase/pantoate ligase/cytidylate kinase
LIITIDGPAGAGKSSAAKALAQQLGFRFLDTGAMYRSVALAALRSGLSWDDTTGLAELAKTLQIDLDGDRTLLNGEDVSQAIRTAEVTDAVRYVADNPQIRQTLVELQQNTALESDFVTEGRDQGTIAFPRAECKIFLTASPAERAKRRQIEHHRRGEDLSFETVLERQNARDQRDKQRTIGRLVPAADAFEVSTDGLSPQEVVERLKVIVSQCRS